MPTASIAGAARLVSLVLTVAVAVSLAQIVWVFVPDRGETSDTVPPPRHDPARAARSAGLDRVIALDLFGRAPVAVVAEVPQDAPDTSLALTLRGLFAVAPKANAWAIIATSGGAERHYRVGDRVAGAIVRDILPDRVILEHGGRFETLRLPRETLVDLGQMERKPVAPTRRAPAGEDGPLRELRDTLAANPQEIGKIVDITPVMEGGELRGYNVNPRRHQDIFRRAGLRPDDVVVGINGIPVTDMARMGDLMAQLQTAERLTLAVERAGGGSLSIDIDMN